MNQQQQDITNERRKGSFPTRQMTYFIQGGEHITTQLEKLRAMVEADPLFDRQGDYFLSIPEKYKRGLEQIKRAHELFHTGQLNGLSQIERDLFEYNIISFHAMTLHKGMFLPTIRGQADDEQLKEWLPKCESYEWIGCYAQTEMGHGSNVRGLETTATFDPKTDEIIMHSPTVTSTKWWPGALGKTANHAIVHARLLLPKGSGFEDKGIHAFLVRIRCQETHKNMPGVTSGMIGPRYGINANDNGFLRLDQVRIPRRNMLSRYTKLERDGTYHLANEKASKLNYGTMLLIRSRLVQGAGGALSIAATIATRYSAVRRQFPPAEDEEENGLSGELAKEVQIIDYQSQQYRVFPHIATAYALFATGMYMRNLYEALQKGIKSNNLDALPEAHATSSGLKAVTTMLAAEGIEECRKSLGGHGYLLNSGLGDLFTAYVANNTLEGENYVIIQQLTRYLAKTFKAAQKGVTPAGNAKYLAGIAQGNKYLPVQLGKPEDLLDPQNQLNIYANRAGYLVSLFSKRMDAAISSGKTFASALQSLQWIGTRASKAHCMYTILVCMNDLVEKAKKNQPALYQPLKNLCDLFALYHAERELGEFLEASQMSPTHASWLHEQTEAALLRIRPDAVCLVDAFNHSDRDLNSALGKYDGNVYEALYNWTKLDPMNKDDVIFCYEDVIRPIIKKDFKSKL